MPINTVIALPLFLPGALTVLPEKLRAEDGDSLRSEVRYSFEGGAPGTYAEHFAIDPRTGIVRQVKPVERQEGDEGEERSFEIRVKVRKNILGTV